MPSKKRVDNKKIQDNSITNANANKQDLRSQWSLLDSRHQTFLQDCIQEISDYLSPSSFAEEFATNWVNNKFKECLDDNKVFWTDLAIQIYDDDDQSKEETEIQIIRQYHEFIHAIWPKYLQTALNDAAYKHKSINAKQLLPSDFDTLPKSHIWTIPEYSLFEDFLLSDFQVELTRLFKFTYITKMAQQQQNGQTNTDQQFLQELQLLTEFSIQMLAEDEANIFDVLINQLEVNTKWGTYQTQVYIEKSFESLSEKVSEADMQLTQFRQNFNKQTSSNNKPESKPASKTKNSSKQRSKSQNVQQPETKDLIEENKKKKSDQIIAKAQDGRGGQKLLAFTKHQEERKQVVASSDPDAPSDSDEDPYSPNASDTNSSKDEYLLQPEFIPKFMRIKQADNAPKPAIPTKTPANLDKKQKEALLFMTNPRINAPHNLPMPKQSTELTSLAVTAAGYQMTDITLSELIKKEYFQKSIKEFENAIEADQQLIVTDIKAHYRRYDKIFGLKIDTKSDKFNNKNEKFTKADYWRFAAVFAIHADQLLDLCEQIALAQGVKTLQPRHLMIAMISSGKIPKFMWQNYDLSDEDFELIMKLKGKTVANLKAPTKVR